MKNKSLEQMAEEVGDLFWLSWKQSAINYSLRLQIPLEKRQIFINEYLIRKYYDWKDEQKKS